jgi:soluble lytic murein transglycosylase-like protein
MLERDSVESSLVRPQKAQPAVGLRHNGERRWHRRRSHDRTRFDRRHAERRKRRLRSLLLSAIAIALPPQIRPLQTLAQLKPDVSVTVNSFEAVPAHEAYRHIIDEAARIYDLDPALIRSVIEIESAYDAAAISPVGAIGLMQLMPAVAAELGVRDIFDPRENIMGGAQLLRALIDRYDGNFPLVLAGYNAGPTAVSRHRGRIPPFPETQAYVRKVTRLWKESRDTQRSSGD